MAEIERDTLRDLNALLTMQGRDKLVTVLSPTPTPNTTWYDVSSSSSFSVNRFCESIRFSEEEEMVFQSLNEMVLFLMLRMR